MHDEGVLVPIVGMMIPIVAIVGGIASEMHRRRLKADERIAMIQRGVSIEEINKLMGHQEEMEQRPPKDPMRSLANARRSALVLLSVGIGLIIFFIVLDVVLQERDVLAGAAAGVIPLAIGVGFWIDYRLQMRELSRFGLEVGQELPR